MKKKNLQIAKISVFITSLFVIFLSVTYAFINLTIGGEKRQVITAGSLELELIEDENNLTITNALPMYDEVGMIQDAFTFRLQNKGTTSVNYKVKLVDITTGEKLNYSDVKIGLTKDGLDSIQLLSSLISGIIDEGLVEPDATIEYALRLWIRDDLEDNQLIKDKNLSFKIEVEEFQKELYASRPKGTLKRETHQFLGESDGYLCGGSEFCANASSVTSIIFENHINIPDDVTSYDISEEQNGSIMMYYESFPDSSDKAIHV